MDASTFSRDPQRIDPDIIEKTVELRHKLHENAELSCKESNTRRMLIEFLRGNTSLEICEMGAWFYAAYRNGTGAGKRRIAFRADMDALPIDEGYSLAYSSLRRCVSHKCGHDGHSAGLAAFALFIDCHGCENDVFFLFQHAEENGVGAAECEKLIEIEKIDEIYAYHNMPGFPLRSVAVHNGTAACASTGLVLKLTGVNSHASQPENGRNPAFALASLIGEIPLLVRIAAKDGAEHCGRESETGTPGFAMSPNGIVMCTVIGCEIGSSEKGGTEAFGTSAGFGRLMLTVRAQDERRLDLLTALLSDRAKLLAEEHGLAFAREERDPFPETRNDDGCAGKVRDAAARLGLEAAKWDEPFRSSEDFGRYTKLTRGALFYIGSGESHAPLHTAGYDFPDELIETACLMFRELAR